MIRVCLQPGKWEVHLLSCVGWLDPEQHEESHFCWSEKRARVHPGSTKSGASLPETFPQGSGPSYSFIFLIFQLNYESEDTVPGSSDSVSWELDYTRNTEIPGVWS